MRSLLEVLNAFGQGLSVAAAVRRYAKQASGQLLELYRQELYRQERRERVGFNSRAPYQSIVTQRLGPEASRAGEIVRRADQSFTDW
jgi:hypothetical protein